MIAPNAPQDRRAGMPRKFSLIISLLLVATMSLLAGCAVQMLGEEGQTAAAAPAATQPEATATPTAETEADTAAESNAASQDEVDDAARLAQLLQVQEARLAYNGEILAEKRIAIAPEVNGLAIAVHVQIGDEVKVGDVLVEIDATTRISCSMRSTASFASSARMATVRFICQTLRRSTSISSDVAELAKYDVR